MFDFTIPNPPLITSPVPSEEFKAHYQEHEKALLEVYAAQGIDASVWSLLSDKERLNVVHGSMAVKKARTRFNLEAPMDMTTDYTGDKPHPKVAARFSEVFPYSHKQFFFITNGEEWWDGEPFFLVHNADTFMQWARYDIACKSPDVLSYGVQRPRGRPRNDAKHLEKAEKSTRYQEWLHQCEQHRAALVMKEAEIVEARLVVDQKRLELAALKMQGAPKWIP